MKIDRARPQERKPSMVVIGLMADPGLPERLTRNLDTSLQAELTSWAESPGSWSVEVSEHKLPLDEDGAIPLMDTAKNLKEDHDWDVVIYVTDLPRFHDHRVLLTESDAALCAALVSLPALGGLGSRRALRDELLRVVRHLAPRNDPTAAIGEGTLSEAQKEIRPAADRHYTTLQGKPGQRRLLAGMVRSNRPGRLVGSLSSAAAAAMATGAFGIFYASIWNMADSSSALRLSLITVLAISVLTTWLIVHNSLWSTTRTNSNAAPVALDNAATVVTVLVSVALMYAGLYVVVFLGSLAIISGHYMQAQLGHPVSIVEYANLSWLSASLGILAGALGSNFDGDSAVQRATYSGREHERRQLGERETASRRQ